MDQAVARAQEVHEGAEIHHLHHLAGVDHADFRLGDDAADPLDGRFGRVAVDRRHLDRAVVVDVDLGAGGLGDLTDHLAAGADHVADLLLGDAELGDPRRVLVDLLAGIADRLGHLVQDVEPAVLGLIQGDPHDLLGDRGDLDVHLQGRDALAGAGHLEVHVAQVILVTQDVGQDGEAVAFLDQAHGDAGHRPLQGHAGVHQRQAGAADRRHG